MAEREPVLRVEGVEKDYGVDAKTRALAGVSFEVARGEFAAIIGPSGSGKSTLLNLIGLLDRPSAGRVILGGVDTSALDDEGLTRLRGRMLGFVFQFHHLLPAFSALENVMLPGWGDAGAPSAELERTSREMLAAVGLADRQGDRPTRLSGGQQQRVAIARALVRRPPLVLADEPTGNLDTHTSEEVFALMRRMSGELGSTFLVVTHDPRIAERCDRVIEIVDGLVKSDLRRAP